MLSADFAPFLIGSVPASLPTPAATLANAPASAATPAMTLSVPLMPFLASASPVPTAFMVTVNAVAASPFHDTSKLVSRWTPAFTPGPALTSTWTLAPTPAAAVLIPSGTIILFADTALTVLRSQIFNHRLQLLCLRFCFPKMSEANCVIQVFPY